MGCCCSTAQWKRDEVQDHKFDFVDVNVFYDRSPTRRIAYCFVFIVVIKSILMMCADIWTAYLLTQLTSTMFNVPGFAIPVVRWMYIVSITASFGLLLWEARKARRIIASRDIAYAYTNIAAYRFYSIRSYAHYCLFAQIGNSQNTWDRIAFFVYFTLKSWKRMLLADAPRQVLNAWTIWNTIYEKGRIKWETLVPKSPDEFTVRTTFFTTTFSFGLWTITVALTVAACILYVPLLCRIRGNLKEYVCHKIDKRIATLLLRKSRKRILEEQREQRRIQAELDKAQGKPLPGDPKSEHIMAGAGRQPTLPTVGAIDEHSRPISAMMKSATTMPNRQPFGVDKRPEPNMYRRPSIESVSTAYSSVSHQPLVRQHGASHAQQSCPPIPPLPGNNANDPYGRLPQQQQPPPHAGMVPSRSYPVNMHNEYGNNAMGPRGGHPGQPQYPGNHSYIQDDMQSEYGGSEYGGNYSRTMNNAPAAPMPPRAPYARSDYGGSDAGSQRSGHHGHRPPLPPVPHHAHPGHAHTGSRGGPGGSAYGGDEEYELAPPRRPASPTGSVSSNGSGRYGNGQRRQPHADSHMHDATPDRYATRGRHQRQYGAGPSGGGRQPGYGQHGANF